jgi:hypothetical protein
MNSFSIASLYLCETNPLMIRKKRIQRVMSTRIGGLVSYDKARETYIFRRFHVEGFVNQYVLEKPVEDGQSISFVTEEI